MGETLLTVMTIVAMIAGLFMILIPGAPITLMECAIALLYAYSTDFVYVGVPAAILISIIGIIGATAGLWMPFVGMQGKPLSCMSMIGFFVGMAAGSILIPIPIVGSMIGGMIGVVIVEFVNDSQLDDAVRTGGSAMKLIIYGMIAEFSFASAIVVVTIFAILSSG